MWPEVAIFRPKMPQFLATFPPICKSFGLFSTKLLHFRLLYCQNSDFGILWNILGYFWGDYLVTLGTWQCCQCQNFIFVLCNLIFYKLLVNGICKFSFFLSNEVAFFTPTQLICYDSAVFLVFVQSQFCKALFSYTFLLVLGFSVLQRFPFLQSPYRFFFAQFRTS